MSRPTATAAARGQLYAAIAAAEFRSTADRANSTISIHQAIEAMLATGESEDAILRLVHVISSEFSV